MSKQIKLTRGMCAIVDDDDYEWISKWKWHVNEVRTGRHYAVWGDGSRRRPRIAMHRLILGVENNREYVDHINGNGLDNRRSNLRICSNSENCRNRGKTKNNKSGYKGVSYYSGRGKKKFQSIIEINGKGIHLGYFYTPEEAARAYDKAAKKYHGEFANINGI